MAAVRAAHRGPQAKSTVGKIQSISGLSTYSIVVNPPNAGLVNTSLIHQVLNQATNRIVDQCGDDGGVQPKAALEPTRNVVFPATFPYLEFSCMRNPGFSRIKPKHHFPQGNQVPAALRSVSNYKAIHGSHLVHWPTLENQAHTELELPHGLSACDLSKSTYSRGYGRSCGVGCIQVDHVEYIHCLAPGLQAETFPELERTEDCQVHVFVTRLIDEVARGVAVHWSPVHWSIPDESSVIEPAGGRPDRSPVQAVAAEGIAHQPSPVPAVPIQIGVRAVQHGERKTAVHFQNRRNRPAAYQVSQQRVPAVIVVGLPYHGNYRLVAQVGIGSSAVFPYIGEILDTALAGAVLQLHAVKCLAVSIESVERQVVRQPLYSADLQSVVRRSLARLHGKHGTKRGVEPPGLHVVRCRANESRVIRVEREGEVMTE